MKLKSIVLAAACGSQFLLSSCVEPTLVADGPPHDGSPFDPGYVVQSLPPGYRTERHRDQDYYYSNGHYYRTYDRGGYVVVESPQLQRETLIARLPNGYRVVERSGVRYYRVGNTYYQQRTGGYVVVRPPF